ncbi:AraC family transcriptional regulator [Parabacteroides sp. OttesenSCG-928-K15]|nr:AraC family transcriptional regulator [Parabacteroides sp. OttesenSCG-928-K15]
MIHLNPSIEILTGGAYVGNSSWSKKRSEIDNCFKIYLLTEGELYLYQDTEKFLLEKDKLYFINGNKLTSQYCANSFSTYWLHFIPKDLIIHQGLLSLPLTVELSKDIVQSVSVMQNIDSLISPDNSSYKEYYLQTMYAQIFLQSLVANLMEQYTWVSPELILNIQRIEPAIDYIKKHLTETIRLKDLSEQCYMSSSYFHKIFTNALNTTPSDYITLLRMNAALELLIDNKSNIKEIAYQLGFNDDAYFSRVFKKYYGITPGEYKKRRNDFLV